MTEPAAASGADTGHRAAGSRVIARRWDQLGARLDAIVNAAAIAELLDLPFGFVWPRGLDVAINQPADIFDRGFLNRAELDPEWLAGRPLIADHELLGLDEAGARARLARDPGAIVEVTSLYTIARGSWEPADAAKARFARCWSALGWTRDIRDLMHQCARASGGRPLAAVHVRAGDIVEGDWRHVLPHEKYLPTMFIEGAIEALGRDQTVLILSDNDSYLHWLRERFPSSLGAAELVPAYAALSEVHRALADICLLSRCQTIVGPPHSAFSWLGANLGAGAIIRADVFASSGREREVLLDGIAERPPGDEAPYRRRLRARDICWCLDVFGDELDDTTLLRLARDAVQLDGNFSGAAARLARIAAVAGERDIAQSAAARALALAEPVQRCPDAIFEALATDIVVRCCALLLSPARSGERCLEQIGRSFGRCRTLQPFWCDRESASASLQTIIDATRSLLEGSAGRPSGSLTRVPDARTSDGVPFASLEHHRAVAIYDPLARDLARIASRLSAALTERDEPEQ